MPNALVPYDTSGLAKVVKGISAVAGMPADGWVETEVSAGSFVLRTSDGLRIEIGAKAGSGVRVNPRGMPLFALDDQITIAGGGLQPNSPASVWLFSTPKELGRLTTDARGSFEGSYPVGGGTPPGEHTAQLNGIAPDGTLRIVEVSVELEKSTAATSVAPLPAAPAAAVSDAGANTPHDDTAWPSTPGKTLALVSSMVALLAIPRAGNRNQSGEGSDGDDERADEGGEVAEVSADLNDRRHGMRQDRIRPPVVASLDRGILRAAARMSRIAPVVGRSINDGAYARALAGVFWLALPVSGAVLGVLGARGTDAVVMTPSMVVVVLLLIVGALDSLAGLAFVAAYLVTVIAGGGLDSVDAVRGMLGLTVLAFSPALVGAAVRPFRREPDEDGNAWQRAVDVVLLPLFGAWVAGTMYSALPPLTTYKPPHSDRVGTVELVVLVTLLFRFVLENGARVLAAQRLSEVELERFDAPYRVQPALSLVVRTAVFLFVAGVLIGNNWALWVGGVLYVVPHLVDRRAETFPNFAWLHRVTPRNLTRVVLMLFVALWWSGVVTGLTTDSALSVRLGFVMAGVPGLVLGAVDWFAREGGEWRSTAVSKCLGTVLLVVGILMVKGVILG